MTNDIVATKVYDTKGRKLDFQEYFVQHQWQPKVKKVEIEGVLDAKPAPGVLESVKEADLVVICPSNTYVSIDPIIRIPGILECLSTKTVIAVSPIVGQKAVKGPLAKMILELTGECPSARFAANYYHQLSILDGYVLDTVDTDLMPEIERWGIICKDTNSIMKSTSDRARLAEDILALGRLMLMRRNNP